MQLRYLGTCAAEGWPAIFCQCDACREALRRGGPNIRRRSGALIDDTLLLDLSPDIYYARVSMHLDLGRVRHMLITHAHSDHFHVETLEMMIAPFAHIENRTQIICYGSAETRAFFDRYSEAHPHMLGNQVVFQVLQPFETYEIDGYRVTPLPGTHSCPGTLLYVVEKGGRRLFYAHDTGVWSETVFEALRMLPCDVVSLDCTNGPIPSTYSGHMGFDKNLEVRQRMLDEGSAHADTRWICNHFSHNGGMMHEQMVAYMRPYGVDIAFDGMTIDI